MKAGANPLRPVCSRLASKLRNPRTVRNRMTIFAATLALCATALTVQANAQESTARAGSPSYQDHFDAAGLLAAQDLAGRNLYDCKTPPQSAQPTGTQIVAPPTKVFDQLYY